MSEKKIVRTVAAALFAVVVTTGLVYADDRYKTEEIGNLTYSVPEDLTVRTAKNDGLVQNIYYSGNGVIIVQYESEKAETTEAQAEKVASLSGSFLDLPDYTEMSEMELSFQNMPADIRIFTYKNGETTYNGKAYVLYTGEGTAAFIYGCPVDAEDEQEQSQIYTKLTGTIRTKRLTDEANTEEETESETENVVQKEFSSGIYKVDDQMPEGEYTLFAEDGNGHVTVSSDEAKDSVKLTKAFRTDTIILAEAGDYIEFYGAEARLAEFGQEVDLSTEGMFEAGLHFEAGTYDLISDDGNGYFCVYTDAGQSSIKTEGPVSGEIMVTVEDGQCLELSDCYFKEEPPAPEKVFTDKETIRKVQEALNQAGYTCGTADGIAGQKTLDAIEKYAGENGLTSRSKITESLLMLLNIQNE